MPEPKPIPTPWKHRWRRFRQNRLPIVWFVLCVGVTLWLWTRQAGLPNTVGEVEAVRADAVAASDGILVEIRGRRWKRLERVEVGALIARLDGAAIEARLATLRSELAEANSQLEATRAQLALDELDRQYRHASDTARLRCDLERYRLDVLAHKAQLAVDRIELDEREARLKFLEPMQQKQVIPELELREEKMLRDQAAKRVEQTGELLTEAESQQKKIEDQLAAVPDPPSADTDRLMEPIQAAIATKAKEIEEIELAAKGLDIKAPISGAISDIYKWPGEAVRAGDAILTIASDDAHYVISSVRQGQRVQPAPGMAVDLRARAPGSRPVEGAIDRVGLQVESIPAKQLRDPRTPEWGVPVRIELPLGMPVRPGDLIDVTFRPSAGSRAG